MCGGVGLSDGQVVQRGFSRIKATEAADRGCLHGLPGELGGGSAVLGRDTGGGADLAALVRDAARGAFSPLAARKRNNDRRRAGVYCRLTRPRRVVVGCCRYSSIPTERS